MPSMHRGTMLMERLLCACSAIVLVVSPASADRAFRKQVEEDWLFQEDIRRENTNRVVTLEADAAGACDGVKNEDYAFHTNRDKRPWWQVDLGKQAPIGRVVIWNRCDGVAARANHLHLLLSDDGKDWRTVYKHDGTPFYGHKKGKPLSIPLENARARFVRVQLPATDYLHLNEVEVFGTEDAEKNLALRQPATQSSLSPWSSNTLPPAPVDLGKRCEEVLADCRRLIKELEERRPGFKGKRYEARLARLLRAVPSSEKVKKHYLEARWLHRELLLETPLLDSDAVLFAKRVPGSFNHMSDQYYGWWSRPGGGLHILRGLRSGEPSIECISGAFAEPGSFMRPMLSYAADKVLFAWCRHYPGLAGEKDKLNKDNVPEDAFYHVFEMNLDGSGLRQLTHGKYDDFDARYLPDRRIVFLSTRRGQSLQVGPATARQTLTEKALPDVYVRCGGGPERPVAVYTLHTMNADGSGLCPISPFEMFEWTPTVADDGRIIYSRWDYVDRDNMPYMSLWSINPDGTNARIVYGNYTKAPHCTFEPRCIPNSDKIIFTASGHHAQTMGSLMLLDTAVDTEGTSPTTRLTPEVAFPEIESWPAAFYAHPWPLSEDLYLVSWGPETKPNQGKNRSKNAMGLYLYDAASRTLELLHRDPDISSAWPAMIQARKRPPVMSSQVAWDGPQEGNFLLTDVYRGLKGVERGAVKALRIVAVPAKTHPTMNYPTMGITRDDPGKCVLGTVPVEADGSAYFRVPSGVILFFQALDERGMAIQTMRSTTHIQPGQSLSCAGCHESRHQAPAPRGVLAVKREPSRITVGPSGSWPFRFDQLIQPVLNAKCVGCHNPAGRNEQAAKFDLRAEAAYESLVNFGKPSLYEHVWERYRAGASTPGGCATRSSALFAKLTGPDSSHKGRLDADDEERFITWMDTYAQRLGSFSETQEQDLLKLRERSQALLVERAPRKVANAE